MEQTTTETPDTPETFTLYAGEPHTLATILIAISPLFVSGIPAAIGFIIIAFSKNEKGIAAEIDYKAIFYITAPFIAIIAIIVFIMSTVVPEWMAELILNDLTDEEIAAAGDWLFTVLAFYIPAAIFAGFVLSFNTIFHTIPRIIGNIWTFFFGGIDKWLAAGSTGTKVIEYSLLSIFLPLATIVGLSALVALGVAIYKLVIAII